MLKIFTRVSSRKQNFKNLEIYEKGLVKYINIYEASDWHDS